MEEENGLFNIELSSSDESTPSMEKNPRDFQSESNFQSQLKTWKPKNEVGGLWKALELPIDHPSKPESQTILHAIEELFFLRRYEEAKKLAEDALRGGLDEGFRRVVEGYRGRCEERLKGGR